MQKIRRQHVPAAVCVMMSFCCRPFPSEANPRKFRMCTYFYVRGVPAIKKNALLTSTTVVVLPGSTTTTVLRLRICFHSIS